MLLDALASVKPRVAARLRIEHETSSAEQRADALLAAVRDAKGRFAQELVAVLDDGPDFTVPDYLREAIEWVTADQDPQTDG